MKNSIKYIIGLGILLVVFMSVFGFVKVFNGKWVCIAQTCDKWIYGDDWITENCRPDDVGGERKLVCKLTVNEKDYGIPLNLVNISNVKSCSEYKCTAKVFVKGLS